MAPRRRSRQATVHSPSKLHASWRLSQNFLIFRQKSLRQNSSLRIAAHPRFAPLHLKNAKPDDTDFVALHEVPGEPNNGVGEHGFGPSLGDFMSFGDLGCEMLQRHDGCL